MNVLWANATMLLRRKFAWVFVVWLLCMTFGVGLEAIREGNAGAAFAMLLLLPALLGSVPGELLRDWQVYPASWLLPRFQRHQRWFLIALGLPTALLFSVAFLVALRQGRPDVVFAAFVLAWTAFHLHTVATVLHQFWTVYIALLAVYVLGVFGKLGPVCSHFLANPLPYALGAAALLVVALAHVGNRAYHRSLCGRLTATLYDMWNLEKMRRYNTERLLNKRDVKQSRDGFSFWDARVRRAPRYSVEQAFWGEFMQRHWALAAWTPGRGAVTLAALATLAYLPAPVPLLIFLVVGAQLAMGTLGEPCHVLLPIGRRTRYRASLLALLAGAGLSALFTAVGLVLVNLVIPHLPTLTYRDLAFIPRVLSPSLVLAIVVGYVYAQCWLVPWGPRGGQIGIMAGIFCGFVAFPIMQMLLPVAGLARSLEHGAPLTDSLEPKTCLLLASFYPHAIYGSALVLLVCTPLFVWLLRRKYLAKDLWVPGS